MDTGCSRHGRLGLVIHARITTARSPTGDEIFYRSIDGERMMAVSVRTKPTLLFGAPRTLFQGQFRLGSFWSEYDVSPKTKDFLMVAVDEPTQPRLAVAMNWLREAAR
jgi:hypothetical protein